MTPLALLADIGGTNTRVALADGTVLRPGTARKYRNAAYPALEPVLQDYLRDMDISAPDTACLAMAGPVRDGQGTLTNLDWALNIDLLAAATGAGTVALLNDLQAQGYAVGHLPATALTSVVPGCQAQSGAARLVIGVGTGFNIAPVFEGPGGRVVPASEAGHLTLPVQTAEDLRLAAFIAERTGFADVEEVLSGRGLGTVHDWHAAEAGGGPERQSGAVMEAFEAGDSLAEAAVRTFVQFFGRVAGDLALSQLPFGGIYLIGGMSRAMAPHMDRFGFAEAFVAKGRFSDFMTQFPVWVVDDDDAALIGSAHHLAGLRSAA